MVDWVRSNNLSFAVRCGGHSYEGLSQSSDVVIDVRALKAIGRQGGPCLRRLRRDAVALYQALAAEDWRWPPAVPDGQDLRPSHRRRPRFTSSHGLTAAACSRRP